MNHFSRTENHQLKWIFDTVNEPQRFPLRVLAERVLDVVGARQTTLQIRRSDGFGQQICKWDDQLDDSDQIEVESRQLVELLSAGDEIFYNLDAIVTDGQMSVRFGLHDSSALFVECAADQCDAVTSGFSDVREDDRDS